MQKYKYEALEQEIIFRTITLDDASRFQNGIEMSAGDPYADEYIFQTITDNQYDIDELDAGIVPIVVFLSFKLSGTFRDQIDIPNKIDESRKEQEGNAFYMMYAAICRSMPGYTLDILKQKTTNEILELFAFAEIIIGKQQVDTDKIRDSLTKPASSKGIKSVTKEEIAGLQEALSSFEFEGVLQDEFRL